MTRGMRLCAFACAALLLACCAGTPGPGRVAPPDASFPVDFAAIARFTEAYRVMRYESDEQVRALVGAPYDSFALVDLPATRNRYMIGTLDTARRQEIWIRGTANFRNALYDLEYRRHFNTELGISLHEGFERMAQAVHDDILPRLRPGYSLVIYGHSLGAAEAVILAMMLDREGWSVSKVYASGQPRVTDAAGEKAFDHLPILRIINVDDPVPYLPPRDLPSAADPYVHVGPAVILLDGPYYALITEDEGNEALAGNYGATLKAEGPVEPVKDHLTPAYLARLEPKLLNAVQVPYAERARYAAPLDAAAH
jgi:triacylglycerol lipase